MKKRILVVLYALLIYYGLVKLFEAIIEGMSK